MRSPRGGGSQGAGFRGVTVTRESGALASGGTPQLLSLAVASGNCEPVPAEGAVEPRRGLGPRETPSPLGRGPGRTTPSFPPAAALGGGQVERRSRSRAAAAAGCRYHRRPAGSASQPNAVIRPDAASPGAASRHEPSQARARDRKSVV